MKSNIIKIILFFMFFLPTSNLKAVVKTYNLTSSSGSISACGEDYENNLTAIWNINTGILKPIIIELNLDIEEGCDFISIYSIDVNNIEHLVGTYDGYTSESIYISTILPTGKAKVVFTTDGSVCYDNGDGYWGVESYYEVDNSYNSTSSVNSVVSQNLIVSGNSYLQGNVGIGTVSPKEKLDVKGSIRGNLTGGALRIKTDYGSLDLGALNSSGTHIYTDLPRFFLNKQVQLITGELSSYNTTNLSLQTNGATRMTILNSNGNVGIGTTNPGTYKLYVNGSTYMNGTTYLNGTSNIIGDLNISKSGSYSNISQYSYSDVNWHGGRISFSRYRGTQTSPTTVLNQDYVGWFDFYGYDGAASQRVGTILIQVDGTPASGKVPGKFAIQTSNNDGVFVNRLVAYANDNIVMGLNGGKVGIGNASPNAKLEVKDGLILINGYDAVYTTNDQLGNKHQLIGTYQGWDKNTIYIAGYNNFNNSTYSTKYISFGGPIANGVGERMFINLLTGKIGIGTTTPDSLLTVRGGIHARSVVVDLVGPLADYVFEPDYNLMPLNEVESFVKKNKHLPSIPSAKDVENKGGVNIGEMQNKLLEKIEELTLYVIQQQKEIDALKDELKRK